MPVGWIEANPFVEETLNQIACRSGPIIYCLESACLLGGTVVVEGSAQYLPSSSWNRQLHWEMKPTGAVPVTMTFSPYDLRANRGLATMTVRIPKMER
ncbi:MAG: hypothetical protein FJ404_16870 [Verrucomicrobia bacterium]|nr:hypothetical protein [Verrucomicrobiota bacterium]